MTPPATRRGIGDLAFSPPEELPPTPLWQPGRPLFSPDQEDRFRRFPREAPLLLPAPARSTASSEVQMEAQRQLNHYVQRYEGEAGNLRNQAEQPTRERPVAGTTSELSA